MATNKKSVNTKAADTKKVATKAENAEPAKKKRRKRKGITLAQLTTFLALVVGVVVFLIINSAMRNKYLKVEQIGSEYSIGKNFNIEEYLSPVNENATVELAEEFDPEEIGTAKVTYTVRCGKLKKTDTFTVEVVDTTYPVIQGPDAIGVLLNESIDLREYYTVDDAQPDLAEELKIDKELDFSEVGSTDYTLGVTDWGNNYSTKSITIRVFNYEDEKKAAALGVREYNKTYGKSVSASSVRVSFTNETTGEGYVLIESKYLFSISASGKCTDQGEIDQTSDLFNEIMASCIIVDIEGMDYFNYNK